MNPRPITEENIKNNRISVSEEAISNLMKYDTGSKLWKFEMNVVVHSVAKEGAAKAKMGSSKPASKKAAAVKKKFVQSSSEDEKPVKKAKGKQVLDSGDDSDFEVENIAPNPRTTGNF